MKEIEKYFEPIEWITISIKNNNIISKEKEEEIVNNLAACFLNHEHTIRKKKGSLQIKV